ncbi:hypothetical protein DENSPDRAFT_602184 [Dentipellis sp. KUC8613]|nr:hypothetical protein DENSPDRAFT_602184 [Dentipellis sp. KUC8613]
MANLCLQWHEHGFLHRLPLARVPSSPPAVSIPPSPSPLSRSLRQPIPYHHILTPIEARLSQDMGNSDSDGTPCACTNSRLTAAVVMSCLTTCMFCALVLYLLRHRIQGYLVRKSRERQIEPFTLFSPMHVHPATAPRPPERSTEKGAFIPPRSSPLSFKCRDTRVTPPSSSPVHRMPTGAAPPATFVYNLRPPVSSSSIGSAAPLLYDALPVSYRRGPSPYESGRTSAAMQSSTLHGLVSSGGTRFGPDPVSSFPTCHVRG